MNDSDPSARELFEQALALSPKDQTSFLDDACGENTELKVEVRDLLVAHHEMGDFLSLTQDPSFSRKENDKPSSVVDAAETEQNLEVNNSTGSNFDPLIGRKLGEYTIRKFLARGGFGEVYIAERTGEYHQQVAIKILRAVGESTETLIERFRRERQALADLQHDSIAALLDGGSTPEGLHYIVMEFIEGQPITEYCDEMGLSIEDRLKCFQRVCSAVQHAHDRFYLHRDIKPNNILVTDEGNPKLLDFGIAKIFDPLADLNTPSLTRAEIPATPAYASPEQIKGGRKTLGVTSDVYSLGIVLYELLTGKLPYRITSLSELENVVCNTPALRPSTAITKREENDPQAALPENRLNDKHIKNRGVSETVLKKKLKDDLDDIVLHALEKDPAQRYPSAREFSDDISRYLSGEPIMARKPSAYYRIKKFTGRHKALMATTALVLVLLITGLISIFVIQKNANTQLAASEQILRNELYISALRLIPFRLNENNLAEARKILYSQVPPPGKVDLRGFEWRYFWTQCQGEEIKTYTEGTAHDLEYSPDGQFLAMGVQGNETNGHKGELHVRKVATDKIVFKSNLSPNSVSFSPSGEYLAAARNRGHPGTTLKIWSTKKWGLAYESDEEFGPVKFSPNGKWFVSSARNRLILRSTQDWSIVSEKDKMHTGIWNWRKVLIFSPDSKLLIAPSPAPVFLKVPSLEGLPIPSINTFPANAAAFTSDGKKALFSYKDGKVLTWDFESNQVVHTFQAQDDSSTVHNIVLSPDGREFATAGNDRIIRIWNATTYELTAKFRGHTNSIWSLAYSHDGNHFATGSFDETVRIWNSQARSRSSKSLPGMFQGIRMAAGSSTLALLSTTERKTLNFHNLDTNQERKWSFEDLEFNSWKISPDLKFIAATQKSDSTRSNIEIWSIEERKRIKILETEINKIQRMEFSADNSRLAVANKYEISVWDLKKESRIFKFKHDFLFTHVRLSLDGKILAASTEIPEKNIYAWDLDNKVQLAKFEGSRLIIYSLAISPNNRWIAFGDNDSFLKIFDLKTQRIREIEAHEGLIIGVSFSSDSNTLASVSRQGIVKLFQLINGEEVFSFKLKGKVPFVHPLLSILEFSSDGRYLLVAEKQKEELQLQIFKAPSFKEIIEMESLRNHLSRSETNSL